MFWPEGLFIILGAVITFVLKGRDLICDWLDDRHVARLSRESKKKPHWREMDYNYLEALNELNVMCPTDTEEEKGLARYLEFNDREDHERRQRNKEQQPVRVGGTVTGSFATLHAPGLGNALSGSLGGLGGLIGGLGGPLDQLGSGQQWRTIDQYRNQLANQQLAASHYAALQQQRSMMQPGTAQNNINPLADLAQALRESKKLDS